MEFDTKLAKLLPLNLLQFKRIKFERLQINPLVLMATFGRFRNLPSSGKL
jgi:hypothetical protein